MALIYVVECADLRQAYIGQTKRWPTRGQEHRAGKVKASAHFFTEGRTVELKVLDEAEAGVDLNAAEKHWSLLYQDEGWNVVSWKGRIGYAIAAGEKGGTYERELGKAHNITPEGREKIREAGRKANAQFTHEQRVEAGRKGGQVHSREHLSKASRTRRRCTECGYENSAAWVGRHQKTTGHSGYTDVETKDE